MMRGEVMQGTTTILRGVRVQGPDDPTLVEALRPERVTFSGCEFHGCGVIAARPDQEVVFLDSTFRDTSIGFRTHAVHCVFYGHAAEDVAAFHIWGPGMLHDCLSLGRDAG